MPEVGGAPPRAGGALTDLVAYSEKKNNLVSQNSGRSWLVFFPEAKPSGHRVIAVVVAVVVVDDVGGELLLI